jgi:hypothetical protein
MQKHRNLLLLMISSKSLTDMEDVSLPSWSTGQTVLVIRARTLTLGLEVPHFVAPANYFFYFKLM